MAERLETLGPAAPNPRKGKTMSKQHAERKLRAAEKGSAIVFQGRMSALEALGTGMNVDDFGIIRDPYAVRRQLEMAQSSIQQALMTLLSIDWPTDDEYDLF